MVIFHSFLLVYQRVFLGEKSRVTPLPHWFIFRKIQRLLVANPFFFKKATAFLVWESTVLVWNVHRNFVLNFFWLMVSTCFTYLLVRLFGMTWFHLFLCVKHAYLLFINHTWDDWLRWRTPPGNQRWHGSQNGGFSSTHKFQRQQGMFGMVTTKQQHSQMRTMVLEYLPTKLGHVYPFLG